MGISEMPLDYLMVLVDRAYRGEVIEEVEILLDQVYEDMREEPEYDQLWEQPNPIIRQELILRLTYIIIDEMRRQQQRELYPQQTKPSRQHYGQTSTECKCSCHASYQRHSSEHVSTQFKLN